MKVSEFKRLFDVASKRKRVNWETMYKEAMEIFCPDRENFYNQMSGQKKGRQVYTSQPTIALDKASNNLHASLTPHMKKWVYLKPGRAIPKENEESAGRSLEQIKDTLFDHIHSSNFDLAASEFYKDLYIGTAALLVTGTAKNPLIFTSVPLHELYIATGPLGIVDKVFRRYKVRYGDILNTWDDANVDKDMQALINESPEKEIEVIEGTVPKKIKVFDPNLNTEVEVDGFGYYVCSAKLSNQGSYLVEREMPVSPWIVARWSVLSGEEWGRGPAILSLNDAKTLNQFVKLHMQSMELTVHPMYTVVDDGVINISSIRIGPGAIIPVSANDGVFGATIAPLRSGGNFQAGQIELQRLEAAINDHMYTEAIGSVTLPVKTATEISIRQEELAKRIGSAYGRLQYEFIKPLINACLYQLDRLNIINMNNFRVDGHNIAIDTVSPLALGQSQEEINAVVRYVEFAMTAFGPQIGLTFMKPDKILEFMGKQLNVPMDIRMSEEEVQQGKEMLAQLSMQQGMSEGAQNGQSGIPRQAGGAV